MNTREQPTTPTKSPARFLHGALVVAIVIVFNLLLNVGLQLVMTEPQYNDFCKSAQVQAPITNQDECLNKGGQWIGQNGAVPPESPVSPMPPAKISGSLANGYCNASFTCSKNFDQAHKEYNRNVFIVLIVGGVLAVLAGIFLQTSSPVALGLTWGGVLSLIIGTVRYWSDLNTPLRFLILLIAFAALIWVGIRKFRD